jgi:hypothetical protein
VSRAFYWYGTAVQAYKGRKMCSDMQEKGIKRLFMWRCLRLWYLSLCFEVVLP